ncbi:MAG: hypothetical protein ACYC3I_13830, partial [Gemmataceae bacterium]
MSINIESTAQEIAALKQFTKLEDDAEAVTKAAREFLRLRVCPRSPPLPRFGGEGLGVRGARSLGKTGPPPPP